MPAPPLAESSMRSVRLLIKGRVQGIGIRPTALRLAHRWQLAGSIANTNHGAVLELQGIESSIHSFLDDFRQALPSGAEADEWLVEEMAPFPQNGFRFATSTASGSVAASVPCDTVVCDHCLRELRDPRDRRYQYPFTSCVDCGPRYSILSGMPYDREVTSLRDFPLCEGCCAEYADHRDRRLHAQTIACAKCGPQFWFHDSTGCFCGPETALAAAVDLLQRGQILAVKGLGGYQLFVDARSRDAVARLRQRKQRPTKPLAILVGSLEQAVAIAELSPQEQRLLVQAGGPIVVARRRSEALLADNVAPGFKSVGVMLPTTPLHALLCDHITYPLVCTSGNRDGEPLEFKEDHAAMALAGIADGWLHHNRLIVRPLDDSVVRVVGDRTCFLRLARGYAPQVLPAGDLGERPIIALGGEQKVAVALSNGAQAVLGPHIGDLTNTLTCQRWEEQVASLATLYGIDAREALWVHDRHPEYFSTQWAAAYQRRLGVQHHHAHIVASMLEHSALDREVFGLAWDGTGYGDDGTIWGGESLRATVRDYVRVAWLRPFPLIGGDQAVREPWRVAVALVCAALGPFAALQLNWPSVSSSDIQQVVQLNEKPHLHARTSSMGRLFDGIAALVLGISHAEDDGRPAMLLEDACAPAGEGAYSFADAAGTGALDWRPVIREIVGELQKQVAPGIMAMRFHRAIAHLAIAQAEKYPQLPLVTSGGVFQNAVLLELLAEGCASRPAGWLCPTSIPPGDGGLAVGQLAIAAAHSNRFRS